MTSPAQAPERPTQPAAASVRKPGRRRRNRSIAAAAGVALLAAMAATTTVRSTDAPAPGAVTAFDPDSYGQETYPEVVSSIEENAVELTELLTAVAADPDAAGEQYGQRAGTGPYTYSVRAEGQAGPVNGTLVPLTVPGVPADTRVFVQVGPAVTGTALRDAVDFIEFGQFVNQVEYADAGTALNNEMRAAVLEGLDPASLAGKTVSVVGATTLLTPNNVVITPVSLEVQG